MKVLIATGIYPPDIGGPATYSKTLSEELPKQGIGAEVLSFGTVRHLPPVIRHFAYLIKALRQGASADIIFAQDPVSTGLPALVAARLLGKKFLLKVVGDFAWEQGVQRFGVNDTLDIFLNERYGIVIELYRGFQKFTARNAGCIIVPSEYLKYVVMKWGINPEKIIVVYNAFEKPPEQMRPKEEIKKEAGITGKIILSAGRLVPWKGFGTLIEIMPEIVKEIPDAKLIIIGGGPDKSKLEILAEGAAGSERIIFTGNILREKVLEYLSVADVFALNTAYEGLSHQILEAMALGAPVVTTDIGGNPELIKDGENGFLVAVNDKNALKSKILELLRDGALSQKLSGSAKLKAGEFTKEKMIEGTVKLISAL